jgi:hypothetical protein
LGAFHDLFEEEEAVGVNMRIWSGNHRILFNKYEIICGCIRTSPLQGLISGQVHHLLSNILGFYSLKVFWA